MVASEQTVQVTVQNGASSENAKTLTVFNAYLREGGNPYMSIRWKGDYDSTSFPIKLEPKEQDLLIFEIAYSPILGKVDVTNATLVIEADDPNLEDDRLEVTFNVEDKGPVLCLNIDAPSASSCLSQPTFSYACVTGCSSRLVYVGNDGTAPLEIEKIDFNKSSSEFSFENPPALPYTLPPKGAPDYFPIAFSVRYCPLNEYWQDEIEVVILANDPNLADGQRRIPVNVKQSPAMLTFSTDSPFGYLDFSEGSGTTHKANIYNKASAECDGMCSKPGQCCGCPIQIKSVEVTPPDAAPWYTVTAKDPATGSVLALPRALKGGSSIDFEIFYQKPAGKTEDRNGTIWIHYVGPLEGTQDYQLSALASEQCEFSIAPTNQVLHFNSVSPADLKEKPAMLINNGNAPCTISHVSVTDKWGSVSEDFSLKDLVAGDTQLAPFSLLPVWVKYSPHSDTPSGFLKVEYVDSTAGAIETAITLNGSKEQACAIPTAEAGDPANYSAAAVGAAVSLNGCLSDPGECGSPLFESGFVWFMLSKPDGSTSALNYEGGCQTTFTPDAAGKYTVGLIVYDGTTFYQSDLDTLDVIAK